MVQIVCADPLNDVVNGNQYTYTKHEPLMLGYASNNFINKAVEKYNATAKHELLYCIHETIVSFINENNIDNINFNTLADALKKFMESDIERFTDLMIIAATMLEEKDTQLLHDYVDDIIMMHLQEDYNKTNPETTQPEVQVLHEEETENIQE